MSEVKEYSEVINGYLSEVFPIINKFHEAVYEVPIIREFCNRSIRFLSSLENKYQPVKNLAQKQDFCKEKTYFSLLSRLKKDFPEEYRKKMREVYENRIFRIVIRAILDCDVVKNPALLDLYADFKDGIDLSYSEEDVLNAIESNKPREELKKDFKEVVKNNKDKIQELEILSNGLNHIKSLTQKEITLDDVSYLKKWYNHWSDLTKLDPFFQSYLINGLPRLIRKYQIVGEKVSESIKLLLSDIIGVNDIFLNYYQTKVEEQIDKGTEKVTAPELTLEQKIVNMLRQRGKQAWDISQALNESPGIVMKELYKMEKKDIVIIEGVNWRLKKRK
jgi:hypothetical protein